MIAAWLDACGREVCSQLRSCQGRHNHVHRLKELARRSVHGYGWSQYRTWPPQSPTSLPHPTITKHPNFTITLPSRNITHTPHLTQARQPQHAPNPLKPLHARTLVILYLPCTL